MTRDFVIRFRADAKFRTRIVAGCNWLHAVTLLHENWPSNIQYIDYVRDDGGEYFYRRKTHLKCHTEL